MKLVLFFSVILLSHFFPILKIIVVWAGACLWVGLLLRGRNLTWEIIIKSNVIDTDRVIAVPGISSRLRRIHFLASLAAGVLLGASLFCLVTGKALPSGLLPIGVSTIAIGGYYATLATCSLHTKLPMDTFVNQRIRKSGTC